MTTHPKPSAAPSRRSFLLPKLFWLFLFAAIGGAFGAEAPRKAFDLPADAAERSLKLFSQQSGREVLFATESAGGVKTNAVKGDYTPQEAADMMLAGTGLAAELNARTGAFTISRVPDPNGPRVAQEATTPKGETKEMVLKLDKFEVMGSKLLNMDLPRSRDDAQPYVIMGREKIEQSGAVNLEDFLKNRLTMDTQSSSASQRNNTTGTASSINLRGLGSTQTLILIDGHRAAGFYGGSTPTQADINSIPLAAVERIEVLPTTASGIYGGGATGGVINVILRRDYTGAELKASYENTFDTDTAMYRVDLGAGMNLEGGKTNVLLAASWFSNRGMLIQDRDYLLRGRQTILANNAAFILSPTSAPPLAATTNIRSTNGTNLTLKTGATLNSPFTYVPAGYAGPQSDGGAALVANAGAYNLSPSNTPQQSFFGGRSGLENAPNGESVNLTVRRQFSSKVQAFLEGALANRTARYAATQFPGQYSIPATVATNPFQQAITVTAPVNDPSIDGDVLRVETEDRRVTGGIIIALPADWKAEADVTWQRGSYQSISGRRPSGSSPDTTAVTNGTLNVLRDLNRFPIDLTPYIDPQHDRYVIVPVNRFTDFALRASGSLFTLPAGPINLSSSLERREEKQSANQRYFTSSLSFYSAPGSQDVNSAYLEANVPLIGAKNNIPGVSSLNLQLAGRVDDYTVAGGTSTVTVGSTTPIVFGTNKSRSSNPTVGLRYQPVQDLILRASYGTGFLPPNAFQITPVATNTPQTVSDPRRGNALTSVPIGTTGGNPNLLPEKSESRSAGVVYTPRQVEGLRVSLDYTHIKKRDNITLLNAQLMVNNEASFPSRITRAAPATGDPFGVGVITAIDFTYVNLAKLELETYDLALDYDHTLGELGKFSFNAGATRVMHDKTQATPTAAVVENVGIGDNFPPKIKANAGAAWNKGSWLAGWSMRYFASYLVSTNPAILLAQGNGGSVPRQIYHDVFVGYHFGPWFRGRFRTSELQVGVKDVFNKLPPLDIANQFSGTFTSGYGDQRGAVYYVSIKTTF